MKILALMTLTTVSTVETCESTSFKALFAFNGPSAVFSPSSGVSEELPALPRSWRLVTDPSMRSRVEHVEANQ